MTSWRPSEIEYEVLAGVNVPAGLPRLRLAVLSPIWRGPHLEIEYPDGEIHILVGWAEPGPGFPCEVRVFWTRHRPDGPAVCLAIGGDAGLKVLPEGASEPPKGLPFLALAETLIPPAVLQVIGSPPPFPQLLLQ